MTKINTSASSPVPSVTVKLLVWEDGEWRSCAIGAGAEYLVESSHNGSWYYGDIVWPFATLEAAKAAAQADYEARIMAAIQIDPNSGWRPMDTAPKDRDILVWYDHNADPHQDPDDPKRLTPYATWADGGDFLLGKGVCVARHHPQEWFSEDEYGEGYFMPAAWFAHEDNDYERVVNPLFWMPLPAPPSERAEP